MSTRFTHLLNTRPYLLADGATGTNLFAVGLQAGEAPELWNFTHPERIADLHRQFVEAGADIILSNSFGGTRYRLKLHQAEQQVRELNIAAARIARQVADASGRDVVVGGSMGPTGELFAPMGSLTFEAAVAAFSEQAHALLEGGVDVLWIETMSSTEEVQAAVQAAQRTGLPVVCTMSFDTNGRSMMGVSPAALTTFCQQQHPHPEACGSNCGVGAPEVVAAMLAMSTANPQAVLIAKANCGLPEYVDGAIRYNGTPELMAEYARLARAAGARIIGGCCGTSPEHLRAMSVALSAQTEAEARPDLAAIEARLGPVCAGTRALLSGEDSPPSSPRRATRRRS